MNRPLSDPVPPTPLGIEDAELVRRAVMFAGTAPGDPRLPRWVLVRDLFQIGGGYAQRLCQRFGLDPDERPGG